MSERKRQEGAGGAHSARSVITRRRDGCTGVFHTIPFVHVLDSAHN